MWVIGNEFILPDLGANPFVCWAIFRAQSFTFQEHRILSLLRYHGTADLLSFNIFEQQPSRVLQLLLATISFSPSARSAGRDSTCEWNTQPFNFPCLSSWTIIQVQPYRNCARLYACNLLSFFMHLMILDYLSYCKPCYINWGIVS